MALRRVDESKYVVFLYEIKYTYTHSNLEINITCGKYIDIVERYYLAIILSPYETYISI